MEKYLGVKVVEAEAMDHHSAMKLLGRPWESCENEHGYLIRYPNGYESWCPKAQFEESNRPMNGMTFGHAIEAAKKGMKIFREGWNGKGMFVVYMPPMSLPPFNAQGTDYFAMYNAQQQWVPGWLASQTDMLAEDWVAENSPAMQHALETGVVEKA